MSLDQTHKNKTRSLFSELCYDATDKKKALYTLNVEDKEYDGSIYPSIVRLYIEESDPTEYRFADKYFCNWEHWKKVTMMNDFQETLNLMRNTLRQKLRAEALWKIQQIAENPTDKNYYAALRFLETSPWEKEHNQESKPKKKVGRPSTSSGLPEDVPDVRDDLRKLIKFYDQTEQTDKSN